ncbi:hypothetical protein EVAR_61987_1 [Eumeta japonica]|uniref:Uncharacterized protein n=1 Tax=Eumeta variegata TaxID=151549 RepID=A0A4C1YHH6_EUMVA|nr:hypothetical protein EVAR_61987_1 [Eumeta japonica]
MRVLKVDAKTKWLSGCKSGRASAAGRRAPSAVKNCHRPRDPLVEPLSNMSFVLIARNHYKDRLRYFPPFNTTVCVPMSKIADRRGDGRELRETSYRLVGWLSLESSFVSRCGAGAAPSSKCDRNVRHRRLNVLSNEWEEWSNLSQQLID